MEVRVDMGKILNLTQHPATPEQVDAGVLDVPVEFKTTLQDLLTFNELPDRAEINRRAAALAELAAWCGVEAAMIGGAPYLMLPLERALAERGIKPLYAFSKREVAEQQEEGGGVRKVSVFRHAGFVPGVERADRMCRCGAAHRMHLGDFCPIAMTRYEHAGWMVGD